LFEFYVKKVKKIPTEFRREDHGSSPMQMSNTEVMTATLTVGCSSATRYFTKSMRFVCAKEAARSL